ncbi:MAG TPA: hypothetical protein VGM13_05405 [Thermoanaerobaculia bacterium]
MAVALAMVLFSGFALAQSGNVTCSVQSTPDVPSKVAVKNNGASAVAAGIYKWTVVTTGQPNKTGDVPALVAGQQVVLTNVGLYSGQVGTCAVSLKGPIQLSKTPRVVTQPVGIGKVSCLVASTPDVPSKVIVKNGSPIAVAAGKFTWTVVTTGQPSKSGPVPALAVGQEVTLSNVGLYSGQVGTCSIKANP